MIRTRTLFSSSSRSWSSETATHWQAMPGGQLVAQGAGAVGNERDWAMSDELRFDLQLVVAGDDGEQGARVYRSPMILKDGAATAVGGMEVLRVIDGRITAVWNCGYQRGVWN